MYCKNCGAFIEDGNRFCEECGTPVVKSKEFNQTNNIEDHTPDANSKVRKKTIPLITGAVIVLAVICFIVFFAGDKLPISSNEVNLYPLSVEDGESVLYGYVDDKGEWVIEPQYSYANDFSEGYAVVCDVYENYGTIDKNGEWVIKPQFSNMEPFSEGLSAVMTTTEWCGYVNYKGEWEIEAKYKECNSFSGGVATVNVTDSGDYAVINEEGDYVIESSEAQTVSYVQDGYIMMSDTHKGTNFILDKKCKRLIDDENISYSYIGNDILFDETNSKVMTAKGKTIAQLNDGDVAIETSEDGLIFCEKTSGYDSDEYTGGGYIINKKGKTIAETDYGWYGDAKDGMLLIYGPYGDEEYIADRKGKKVCEEDFIYVKGFNDRGISYAEKYGDENSIHGYINKDGEWIVQEYGFEY